MTTIDRPATNASEGRAYEYQRGTFDPELVEVFLRVLDKLESRSRLSRAGGVRSAGAGADESGAVPIRAELDPLGSGAVIPSGHGAGVPHDTTLTSDLNFDDPPFTDPRETAS